MNTQLTEFQETCKNMYKTGGFDLDYINKGFVDFELDNYKPMFPNTQFESTLKIYLKYMSGDQYQKKGSEARERDKRAFEHDNEGAFKSRNIIIAHNKRIFSILTEFLNDLDPADLMRRSKLKYKLAEFERVINSMPEYKEPNAAERGHSITPYAVLMAMSWLGI